MLVGLRQGPNPTHINFFTSDHYSFQFIRSDVSQYAQNSDMDFNQGSLDSESSVVPTRMGSYTYSSYYSIQNVIFGHFVPC